MEILSQLVHQLRRTAALAVHCKMRVLPEPGQRSDTAAHLRLGTIQCKTNRDLVIESGCGLLDNVRAGQNRIFTGHKSCADDLLLFIQNGNDGIFSDIGG